MKSIILIFVTFYSFSSEELKSSYLKLCNLKGGLLASNNQVEIKREASLLCYDLKTFLRSLEEGSDQEKLLKGFVRK